MITPASCTYLLMFFTADGKTLVHQILYWDRPNVASIRDANREVRESFPEVKALIMKKFKVY